MSIPNMTFKDKKTGRIKTPLQTYVINDSFILAAYQGNLSRLDILLKYKQKENNPNNNAVNGWSRLRTPKHIHWAVDILIKMNKNKRLVQSFLDFLLEKWRKTRHHVTIQQRANALRNRNLIPKTKREARNFVRLNRYGEYKIKFLILLAKLLMQQEKNNRRDARKFKELLLALKEGKSIYKIVSAASFTGRK